MIRALSFIRAYHSVVLMFRLAQPPGAGHGGGQHGAGQTGTQNGIRLHTLIVVQYGSIVQVVYGTILQHSCGTILQVT
jgi:hypothetical protein